MTKYRKKKGIAVKFQAVSDWASTAFASYWFMLFHAVWWGSWVAFRFEAFPYGLLTLIVSLESILLSGLILNATNRSGNEDRRIIEKDLKLDQASHDHLEEIRRNVKEIMNVLQIPDQRS